MSRARAIATLVVLCGVSASSASSPVARCQARKLVAAGRDVSDLFRCHADANGTTALDPACSELADRNFALRFARADAHGGCVVTGDADVVRSDAETTVDLIRLANLKYAATGSSCTAARLRAAGRDARALSRAYAHDRRRPDPTRLDRDLLAARRSFLFAFAQAIGPGDCLPTDDLAVTDTVEQGMATIVGRLVPVCGDFVRGGAEECDGNDWAACPLACKADCTCPFCGDGRRNRPTEQCDGADSDACSGLCRPDCTCPPPVCGNGVLEAGEACDGALDAPCPGLCQTDCTCPSPVCGNGVLEQGEECEADSDCDPEYYGGCTSCRCCVTQFPCWYPPVPCCVGACVLVGPGYGICE